MRISPGGALSPGQRARRSQDDTTPPKPVPGRMSPAAATTASAAVAIVLVGDHQRAVAVGPPGDGGASRAGARWTDLGTSGLQAAIGRRSGWTGKGNACSQTPWSVTRER
jgi:hypothetical protein